MLVSGSGLNSITAAKPRLASTFEGPMHLSFFQNLLSYLVPVRVLTMQSPQHDRLELYRYRSRWQLATGDAFYSDGAAYSPLRKAFAALRKQVSGWKDVLVLGAGIGSAVLVLDQKHRHRPQLTLVDTDEAILQLAGELLAAEGHAGHVELICEDAERFVGLENRCFDAVVIDIFRGREVPAFAVSEVFLNACLERLRPGGFLIMNFIINVEAEWERLEQTLTRVTPGYTVLAQGINRMILWEKIPEKL